LKVAVYYNNNDVRVEERPRPSPGRGELLMRIEASGICGSDVMEWYRVPRAPLVLGHEVAGSVEQVGEGVEAFRAGDRIVTTHHVPCGECHYCNSDRHSVCETLRRTSFDPGGFAELVRLPAINVERGTFHLPDKVSFVGGSFVEPLACVVRAQRIAGLRPGTTVAVLGAGISGILQIQYVRSAGAARIYATDVSAFRLEFAKRFGADVVLSATADVVAEIREDNQGRGVDQVVVCTAARAALDQALRLVDDGGTVLCFAPLGPDELFPMPMNELWRRGVQIVNSYAGPPAEMRAAIELIASGQVDVDGMVTHRLGLDRAQEGFRLMIEAGESLKIILEPQR